LADLDRNGLLAEVGTAEVLWIRLRHRIDREVLQSAPRLRIIATPTTGLNHVDMEEAARRHIRVLSLKGETDFLRDVPATAEHTIGLILSLLRNVPRAFEHAREGGWNRDLFRGTDLSGKIVGVIGYGRIGRMVARYLMAFGAEVMATDPRVSQAETGVAMVTMDDLLRKADIVTLHASLSAETTGMFGPAQFSRMKTGAWFINTARGELVQESSLLQALESGRIAGAALDVLCNENSEGMAGSVLIDYARQHDNLIVTPHVGGCTTESMEKTEVFLAGRVAAAIEQGQYVCAE
jgi:D-3-phosphoglycerate dehydrogenase